MGLLPVMMSPTFWISKYLSLLSLLFIPIYAIKTFWLSWELYLHTFSPTFEVIFWHEGVSHLLWLILDREMHDRWVWNPDSNKLLAPLLFLYSVPPSLQPSFSYLWLENGLSLNILHFLCCKWSTTFQTCSSCIINHFSYLEDRMHWNVLPLCVCADSRGWWQSIAGQLLFVSPTALCSTGLKANSREKISIITYLSNQLLQYAHLWSLHLSKMRLFFRERKRLVFLLM